MHRYSFDGRAVTRDEVNLLLIELKQLPAGRDSPAKSVARVVDRAVSEQFVMPLSPGQTAVLRRVMEGIKLKRHTLPPGLAKLRAYLRGGA